MDVQGCPFPDELLYDVEEDTWLRPGSGGEPARVGLTSLISSFAGRFTRLEFRPLGGLIDAGRSLATVESLRYIGAVRLPVRARLVSTNDALIARPRLLNDDPYGEGWVAKVQPEGAPGLPLRTASEARALLAERRERLAVHCLPAIPDATMVEVGVECQTILARLDEEISRREPSEVVLLVTDDPTSPVEMQRWLDRRGHAMVHQRREGTLYHFLVRKEAQPRPRRPG